MALSNKADTNREVQSRPAAEPIEYAGMTPATGMNPSLTGSLMPESKNQEVLEWGGMGNPFEQLSLLLNSGG